MNHSIAPADRLIFALDVDSHDEALHWVDQLDDAVGFYKIGMQLLGSGDYFKVLDELARRDKSVFVDLKFHDVPATVAAAVKRLSRWPVRCCTVHSYRAMLQAAAEVKGDMQLLAVTVLTSMDQSDLVLQGNTDTPQALVLQRAAQARDAGCDGVIASGQEAAAIRAATANDFLIVCPGIRAADQAGKDDQKRALSAGEAIGAGADHLVVGRPIRLAERPKEAALLLRREIESAISEQKQ